MPAVEPLQVLVVGAAPPERTPEGHASEVSFSHCASHAEAVRLVRASAPDVLLLDPLPAEPFTTGVAASLRDGRSMLPVVVVTGDDQQCVGLAALVAGADEVIERSLLREPAHLVALARRANARRMAATLGAAATGEAFAAERLREGARFVAIGQIASAIAHDFNNVLSVATLASGLLLEDLPAGSTSHLCATELHASVTLGASLSQQLLDTIRLRPPTSSVTDLDAAIRDVSPLLKSAFGRQRRCEVALHAEDSQVRLERGRLSQLLLNLVVNARDAVGDDGLLAIRTFRGDTEVVVAVEDNGCGMPPEVLARAFDAFYSTKPAAQGTGLGLASVKAMVDEVGGRIDVRTSPGEGTAFIVRLPLATEQAA